MQRALLVLVAAAVLALASPAPAQDAGDTAQAERETLVREYLAAIDFDKLMDATSASITTAQMESFPGIQAVPAETRAIIADVTEQVMREMRDRIIDRYVVLYAEVFSEAELRALVDFYESDMGRSITAKSQIVAVQGGPILAEIMPEIQSAMQTRLCARIKCPDELK